MTSWSGGHGSYSQLESNGAIVSRLAQQDKVPWYQKPNLRLLYLLMFPTCIGVNVSVGFHSSMLNGLQAVPSWLEYYHHPRSAWLGLMSAVYPLGSIFVIPFVPFIVDKYGRRYSIVIGSILMIIGAVLQGSALNFSMFVIARFFLGFGKVFSIVAASSLIGELSHPKERAIMGAMLTAIFKLGTVSAAAVTLATFSIPNNWGWRIPSFCQAVPSLLQLLFIWFLPESPRWLISKGKMEEAHAILVKYHAEGDENSEFVRAEYSQIEQTLSEELKDAQMSWSEVLSTKGMRRRAIIASSLGLFVMWCGNGPIAHFLSFVLNSIGIRDKRMQNIINFVRTGWELFYITLSSLIVPRYPRRRIYLMSAISLFVVIVAWTAASAQYTLTHSLASSQAVLVLIFLFSLAYNVGMNSLTYTYLIEIFPFHVRARGVSIYTWWNRFAGVVSQFMDPIGIDVAGWKYYIIFCVWNAFQVVFIYFMYPETSGRTLEELTFLFEDDHGQEVSRNDELEPLLHGHREEAEVHGAMDESSRETSRIRRR